MSRLNFIVEGQTEETFVRDNLSVHLAQFGVFVSVRCVITKLTRSAIHRGGMTTFGKARGDIERWLKEDKTAHLTTMFDLYGLPKDFPGITSGQRASDPVARAVMSEVNPENWTDGMPRRIYNNVQWKGLKHGQVPHLQT